MAELRRDVLDVARELGIDLTDAHGGGAGTVGSAGSTGLGRPPGTTRVDPSPDLDLRGSTPSRLLRAQRMLERALRCGEDPGLELLVMEIGRGASLQSRLASSLVVGRSAVSQMVDTAAQARLVERRRHRADGRRWVLTLTAEGRVWAEAAAARWRAADERLLRRLTAAERDELRRLLRKAAAALAGPGPVA